MPKRTSRVVTLDDAADVANQVNGQWQQVSNLVFAQRRPTRFGGGFGVSYLDGLFRPETDSFEEALERNLIMPATPQQALEIFGRLNVRVWILVVPVRNITLVVKIQPEYLLGFYALGQLKKRQRGTFAARDGMNAMRIRIPHD